MESIHDVINQIAAPDASARECARARWNSLAKPLGSLGLLEDAVCCIAALRGDAELRLDRRTLLIFCADNGVVKQGVSQCGSEVTAKVAVALAEDRSSVSPMARAAGCRVIPVDMGMKDFPGHPGVWDRRVRNGTGDISRGPAMTRAECLRAMETGAALAASCGAEALWVASDGTIVTTEGFETA